MISFQVTAIDIILVISVMVLLILYLTNFSVRTSAEKTFRRPISKDVNLERLELKPQSYNAECSRGFGNIKKLGADNSISERCLGCYRLCECYNESEQRTRSKLISIKNKIKEGIKSKVVIHSIFSDHES